MQLLIFSYGLFIGSFLNVCIYRIPKEESIVFPPSHCSKCGISIKWYDNIPIFSYLILKGKCRNCKSKISPQYPLIELFNAIIYVLLFYKINIGLDFIFYALILSILIVIASIDLKEMIIPDSLVLSILILSILHKMINYAINKTSVNLLGSIGGLLLAGSLFIIIILVSKGGMGGGDVTLIGALGFVLGIKGILLTIVLSFILGGTISIILLITKIKGKKDPIPFGPFIILGFTITLFWGEKLVNWYFAKYMI